MKYCDLHMSDGVVNNTRNLTALKTQFFPACILLWLRVTYKWLKDS